MMGLPNLPVVDTSFDAIQKMEDVQLLLWAEVPRSLMILGFSLIDLNGFSDFGPCSYLASIFIASETSAQTSLAG
jgi:hypothetical protein